MVKGNGKGWFRRKRGKLLYCWYNDAGQERTRVIGDADLSDGDAREIVGELALRANVGRPDPKNAIFGQVLKHWLDFGKTKTGTDKDHSTKATDRHNAEDYLSYWASRIAKDIQPVEIQTWLDQQSYGLRSKLRSTMSALYLYGQKNGFIPRGEEWNPMKFVSAPTVSEYEAVSLGGTEAAAVIRHLKDPLLKTLVILIAATGMRISEAVALTWSMVNWTRGKIRIARKFAYGAYGKPKSKMSAKPIEMTPGLAAVLRTWRGETMYAADSDLMFPSYRLRGKTPRSKGMAAKLLRQAAIQAGILEMKDGQAFYDGQPVVRFGFHNLRHGIATWLAEQGTDPVVIQRMLRHADANMTMHYVHISKQARKAQEQYIAELGLKSDCGYTLRVQ